MSNVCALNLKDIRLIKDKVTNTSRGFCFVELNNMEVSWFEKTHIKFTGTNSSKSTPLCTTLTMCGCDTAHIRWLTISLCTLPTSGSRYFN